MFVRMIHRSFNILLHGLLGLEILGQLAITQVRMMPDIVNVMTV